MSLKAKIEAVIYASEEPVTLAQLVGLLGQEAQQELDRLAARQQRLHLAGSEDVLVSGDGGESVPQRFEPKVEPGSDPTAEALGLTAQETTGEGQDLAQQGEASGSDGTYGSADPIAEEGENVAADGAAEKRMARERDRKLREFLREIVAELIQDYATSDRGLEVREVAGGFRMATKPEYHDAVRGFVKSLKPPLKLSLQALETLAVVAYKQPVTAPEISEIRGVDSGGVLGSLMARKLITTAGRKQVIGRPILYKTTKDFLLRFGLKDVGELPSIEEFEKMAGELSEQEEIPMSHDESSEERITHENLLEEKNVHEPQADGDDTSLQEDDSNRPSDEMPAIDGRLSGLPPREDVPGDDPSADEAAIQSGE
jgi:segregation and condensation protein B